MPPLAQFVVQPWAPEPPSYEGRKPEQSHGPVTSKRDVLYVMAAGTWWAYVMIEN